MSVLHRLVARFGGALAGALALFGSLALLALHALLALLALGSGGEGERERGRDFTLTSWATFLEV